MNHQEKRLEKKIVKIKPWVLENMKNCFLGREEIQFRRSSTGIQKNSWRDLLNKA